MQQYGVKTGQRGAFWLRLTIIKASWDRLAGWVSAVSSKVLQTPRLDVSPSPSIHQSALGEHWNFLVTNYMRKGGRSSPKTGDNAPEFLSSHNPHAAHLSLWPSIQLMLYVHVPPQSICNAGLCPPVSLSISGSRCNPVWSQLPREIQFPPSPCFCNPTMAAASCYTEWAAVKVH